ncbi:hypothetical protein AVEN_73438-1 [Araneus ventricosus]|uniref:Uncharacterized protein n=1 Tax=Araneus ventricosus TaxID=182803 RepID=A0A4Y2GKY5_ARAVE|nr:hypothetical protein AVEN_73438-1 [Araneus ventricosus]
MSTPPQSQRLFQRDSLPSKFCNILNLAAINAWVIYKEIDGAKIKRLDDILNLADELQNNYVSSKTSTLSDFTPGTDNRPSASSRKRKQCHINRCRNKTVNICCDSKKSDCSSCTCKMITLIDCRNCNIRSRLGSEFGGMLWCYVGLSETCGVQCPIAHLAELKARIAQNIHNISTDTVRSVDIRSV